MDLRLTAEQQQLVDAFGRLYEDLSSHVQVQAAEPAGHDPVLWRSLLDTGAVAMAVPAERGGYGADLLDLALVAEQHGRHAASAPLIEAQVAARLLARSDRPEAEPLLADALAGRRLVTLAVRPASDGCARLLPAGAVADEALVLVDGNLVAVPVAQSRTAVANLGGLPLADVELPAARTVLADGPSAVELFAGAVDEWRVLTAAALSGAARRALELAVDYVRQRTAFGRALGSFQAIAHPLADRVTEVDGCELLVREAAWSAGNDPDRAPALAAMAFAFAVETARDATYDALHFHGGYGFMQEFPLQLYYRRARAWGTVLEDPATGYRHVAGYEMAGAR